MRVFDHPNMTGGFICPICGKGTDAPVTLIGIRGTERDRIMEARQYHIDCIELTSVQVSDGEIIAQKYPKATP